MRRLFLLLALVVLASSLIGAAPAGAQYGGPSALVIDPPALYAGDLATLRGYGCGPRVRVEFELVETHTVLGATTTDDHGEFAFGPFRVDPELAPGIYHIRATCEESPRGENVLGLRVLQVTLEVLPRERARPATALPFTGAQIEQAAKVAALLLSGGALLVLAARKRRATPTLDGDAGA